ncbi:MAG TPA: hypothetical protein VMC79_06730, partial [Rectinemataceae bacterium]|nr:hypothetical protein [Rectinemataceae bacterium]
MFVLLRRPGALVGAALLLVTLASARELAVGHRQPVTGSSKERPGNPAQTGLLMTFSLEAAPFPDPARAAGYSYDGEDFPLRGHYDDASVAVFVPPGWRPGPRVDLVFFFHGWYSSIPEALQTFSLKRQFASSGRQALLVVPETARDAPDSYGGKLERPEGFDRLIRELMGRLRADGIIGQSRLGSITLVGHSGAYRVIARILGQGGAAAKVREVCLFDALYQDVDRFSAWIASGQGRFVSVCAADGDPVDNAERLADNLHAAGVDFVWDRDDPDRDDAVL